VKFFIDCCLPIQFARALSLLDQDNTIEHLLDKYKPDTLDVVWLRDLGKERVYNVVSRDDFRKSDEEKRAVRENANAVFILAGGYRHMKLWDLAQKVVGWWPRFIETSAKAKPGQCFRVPTKGAKLEEIP